MKFICAISPCFCCFKDALKANVAMIYHLNTRNTLHGVLADSPYELKASILIGFASEITSGLAFLHKYGIVHGLLDSWNISLDKKWTVKIGNWMQVQILETKIGI